MSTSARELHLYQWLYHWYKFGVPRRSFDQLEPARRAQILAVAAEEFGANGFHGTSYNQLLARIGLGKSSAYHYFEDKADLFRTAVADRYSAFFEGIAALEEPTSAGEFWQFVHELNLRGFRFMLEDPVAAALMQCLVREAQSLDHVLGADEVLGAVEQHHERLLKLGRKLGAVRDDLPLERLSLLSRTLAAAADQAFVADVRREGGAKIARRLPAIAQEWTEALERLLLPAPRSARPRSPAPRTRQLKNKGN